MANLKKKLIKELKGVVLVFAVIGLLIGAVIGYIYKSSSLDEGNTYVTSFALQGEEVMIVTKGQEFEDPGYKAAVSKISYDKYVVVTGKVNTDSLGTYILTYKLDTAPFNVTLTRTVIVVGGE